jgi:preprotein translocase subunit YajC
VNLLPIAAMFVILYFLMIRPQQRRAREHETLVQNLKRGDDIVTSGGIPWSHSGDR